MTELGLVQIMAQIAMGLLGLALVLTFLRLLRGPSLPDRVVALDLIALLIVAMIGVHVLMTREPTVLRAGVVVALLAFLGTVAFARYLERSMR